MPDAVATTGGLPAETLLLVAGVILVSMFLALAAGMVVIGGRPRRRLRKRMEMLGLAGAGAAGRGNKHDPTALRQRRIQEKLQELEKVKIKQNSSRNRLRAGLLQAGLTIEPGRYLLITTLCGAAFGGVMFLMGTSPLVSGLLGVVGAYGLPKLVLNLIAASRRKKFTAEFANAIDVLVRGIRSGLPVGECLNIIGRELPDPVGQEFRLLVEGQRLGMSLDELMRRGLERFPTPEYRFFAIVLQIQQQTGGNLAETLAGLSTVLRERKKMRDKVKALSSEARSSAAIIGALPFLVSGLVYLMNPDYIGLLFTERTGNIMLAGGLLWMGVGVVVMMKMVNFKI